LKLLNLGHFVRGKDFSEDSGDAGLSRDRRRRLLVVARQQDDVQSHPLQRVDRQMGLGLDRVRDAEDGHQNT